MTKIKNHQNWQKSTKCKITKTEKVTKLKTQKLIKKVSKLVKKSKTSFLGRKRKRRGSMRFDKNAPTRWLGKHIKWHLPLKVTYPPFFDPFSHFDTFFVFFILLIFSVSHFLHFHVFHVLLILVKSDKLIKWPLFAVRPYYGVKIIKIRVGEITQGGDIFYVWWFSPQLFFDFLFFVFCFSF